MKLRLFAKRTIPIAGLAVQPTTFGWSHTLKFSQGTVTISLPESPHVHASSERLTSDPENVDHTWIGVDRVNIEADLFDEFYFEGNEQEFNSVKILRSPDLKHAFSIVEALLDDGFDLWKRSIRWTALAPNVGIDEIETAHSATRGHGFELFRKSDGVLVRAHGGKSTSHGLGKVSREAWESATKAFDASEPPPVWFDFLLEAFRQITVGNNRAAVVSAAIGTETVIRACFRATLPNIDDPFASRVLEEVPIQKLLSNWGAIARIDKTEVRKQGCSKVHILFDTRNALMHEGLQDSSRLSAITDLIPCVTKFILAADENLRLKCGLPQRIFAAPRVIERLTGR